MESGCACWPEERSGQASAPRRTAVIFSPNFDEAGLIGGQRLNVGRTPAKPAFAGEEHRIQQKQGLSHRGSPCLLFRIVILDIIQPVFQNVSVFSTKRDLGKAPSINLRCLIQILGWFMEEVHVSPADIAP